VHPPKQMMAFLNQYFLYPFNIKFTWIFFFLFSLKAWLIDILSNFFICAKLGHISLMKLTPVSRVRVARTFSQSLFQSFDLSANWHVALGI
jgi:hypothetical protein